MDRQLGTTQVEGEVGLVIQYQPGEAHALAVLEGAMAVIAALDELDHCLLSSIDSSLEPVSILNDVQHASLKILLARALRSTSDETLQNLDWRSWLGDLLVKAKYRLLPLVDADAPAIRQVLAELEPDYRKAPNLVGYEPPKVADTLRALQGVEVARSKLHGNGVTVQTQYGDVVLPDPAHAVTGIGDAEPRITQVTNQGREFFKVRKADMLGEAQWTLLRGGKSVSVTLLHKTWLAAYQRREIALMPGDSLECRFEETVYYDADQNEVRRDLAIIEVLRVIPPPIQLALL
jgi:hypothetical protein